MNYDELISKVEEFAKKYYNQFPDHTRIWNEHIQPVRKFALKLAEIENADKLVVEIAAILHDIGRYKGREDHHFRGYQLAREFLKDVELSYERKELILKCILKHRSRFSEENNELEVKVVQCADALGTIFDDNWQENSRKLYSKEELLGLYDKAMKKVNLESARKIAKPKIKELKEMLR
jgi:uncharacterized protein